jgi:hypothetical protein
MITDIKQLDRGMVCRISPENILGYINTGFEVADADKKSLEGYRRVKNIHVLRALNYHVSEDRRTHSMCCRINAPSKMHDIAKKSSEEKQNDILRLATRPVYLQIQVDSSGKFVKVAQSFCPCMRAIDESMEWHKNAYCLMTRSWNLTYSTIAA